MSIVKLINLNKNIILGKAAKVTSPSEAVGGKIISDAFGGGKIQPKGISEFIYEKSVDSSYFTNKGIAEWTDASAVITTGEGRILIRVEISGTFEDNRAGSPPTDVWTRQQIQTRLYLDTEVTLVAKYIGENVLTALVNAGENSPIKTMYQNGIIWCIADVSKGNHTIRMGRLCTGQADYAYKTYATYSISELKR